MILSQFIAEHSARPFAWGRSDCLLFMCDWVVEQTGRDPASEWRGRWLSGVAAIEILADLGGLEAAARAAFEREGFAQTDAPNDGDCGIVLLKRPVCAIHIAGRWAAKGHRGVAVTPAPVLVAWSLA